MKSIKTMNKLIAGAVTAAVVLSTSSAALAKTSLAPSEATQQPGSITSEGQGQKGEKVKMKMHFLSSDAFKTELDTLVKTGVITQAQEDKVLGFVKQKLETRQQEMAKLRDMSEEERKSYFEQNKKNRVGIFKEMVNDKLITEKQADAIKEAVKKIKGQDGDFHGMKKGHMPFKAMKGQLDNMVKDKKLTQAQEDKVLDYMNKKKVERKAEKEKIMSMTEEQRKTYFEQKRSQGRPDFIKELVDQKLLSEDQAKILKDSMPMMPKGDKLKNAQPNKAQ